MYNQAYDQPTYNNGQNPYYEVENQKIQINNYQNETLDISRNIKKIALDTEEIGGKTLVELAEQGEKINQVELGQDAVNAKLDTAEDGLDDLDKCCGCCLCCWNKKKRSKKYKKCISTVNHVDIGIVVYNDRVAKYYWHTRAQCEALVWQCIYIHVVKIFISIYIYNLCFCD